MTDYYAVLGLSRSAEADAIAKAYRRNALTYNPQSNIESDDPKEAARIFKLVSEAYVVLSDPKLRAIYDMYGEDGVRHGGTGKVGVPGGLAVEKTEPNAVFRKFFGVDSPFQVLGDISGLDNTQHQFYSQEAARDKNPPKTVPVDVTLDCTLEEVFYGASRKVCWKATSSTAKEDTTTTFDAEAEFTLPKGIRHGNFVTLLGKGSKKEGLTQGDVHVHINIVAHPNFTREGDDLITVVPITLADALAGTSLNVQTIEGRHLAILIDEIVHPKFTRVICGEGMVKYGSNEGNARGNLIIKCETEFPAYLSAEQKSEIRRILSSK